jgi:hypothetical protein
MKETLRSGSAKISNGGVQVSDLERPGVPDIYTEVAAPAATLQKTRRDELRRQRALLAEEYDKHPDDLRFAAKIRLIDDEIANCSASIVKPRK